MDAKDGEDNDGDDMQLETLTMEMTMAAIKWWRTDNCGKEMTPATMN